MQFKQFIIFSIVFLCASCAKNDKTFLLKQIKLNHFAQHEIVQQSLYLKLYESSGTSPIKTTDVYPSDFTLPASYAIHPKLALKLYQQNYRVELWGSEDGKLGSCEVDMDNYKIIFPIELEAESELLSVSLSGSWE